MKNKIEVGRGCEVNIERLIATRMLINANSGGGKSWAIRRILEQSHGQVQQIIIDLEGEFSTLREQYDYLLVGKDGEIPSSIRTAELLAKKLLELNVSTIIDLSELKHHERILFVKRFLDSLVNSPKNLWHPALVIVDEAHQFCPEKSKSESSSSVIDLMTRGRKRGFCGILATQRISKLHKDACAEANNYLTGRTGLDIDMKRAGEILGFVSKEDVRNLRFLKAGEFYSFGPAFKHDGIKKVFVGSVNTIHPDRTKGIDMIKATPTPDNIKKIMKDVIDLPKEVEEELRTKDDMQKKIRELKTELRITKGKQTKPVIDNNAINKAEKKGWDLATKEYNKEFQQLKDTIRRYDLVFSRITNAMSNINPEVTKLKAKLGFHELKIKDSNPITKIPVARSNQTKGIGLGNADNHFWQDEDTSATGLKLRAGAMKMLSWLAGAYPNYLTKQRLATLSGFSVKGGTFNTYISELKRNGWIIGSNELSVTEDGLKNVEPSEIPSGEELLNLWKNKFRDGAARILQYLYNSYPKEVSKIEIGDETGFEPSGGTFNTYLSELRKNGLIKVNGGSVIISEEFFD